MLMTDPRWVSVQPSEPPIDGRWLRTVRMPPARAFARGYDRDATDGLLQECAEAIDELTDQLQLTLEELTELRRQTRTRTARRSGSRARAGRSGRAGRRRLRVRRQVRGGTGRR